jgi:hypothetical protein
MSDTKDLYLNSGKPLTLFLDIDGPFYGCTNHIAKRMMMRHDCVQNLQYIVNKYQASVCWISSWRRSFSSEDLFNVFIGAGLTVLREKRLENLYLPSEEDNYEDRRGPIITRYCEDYDINLDEILIIDDDGPITLLDRWVNINTYDGFNYSRVFEAERILNGEPRTRNALGTLIGYYPEDIE